MTHKLITSVFIATCIMMLWTLHSCKKDKEATGIDKQLFDMAVETAGFVWYKNSPAFLPKSSGSGHNYPLLRTRYNATAAAMLDSTGKIIPGSVFPDGSLIVKELNEDQNTLGRYAILYKKASDSNADAQGWVWGYISADETVAAPASDKGSGCIGCHTQADNIDYMLMNKFFP